MLTPEQKAHFETFGFLVCPKLFSKQEIQTIKRETEEIFEQVYGTGWSQPKERLSLQPFFERRPFLAQLADDDRIYCIAEDLLGDDFVLDGTEGHRHVGDTHWHGGGGSPEVVRSVKIAFYVEPLKKETGCIRFIPGSNCPEFGEKLKMYRGFQQDPNEMPFGIPGEDVPSVAFEPVIGDVALFTEHTYHASFGGRPGRYQLAISFFQNPKTEEQVGHIRAQYDRSKWSFRPSKSYINSERPRIRRMVSKLIELGFKPLDY